MEPRLPLRYSLCLQETGCRTKKRELNIEGTYNKNIHTNTHKLKLIGSTHYNI